MKEIPLPPRASSLSESMRDLGYSLETAIADIIDNSISALASSVKIYFDISSSAKLVIIDNGYGMTEKELINAMRHGSRNPRTYRAGNDLGRFGLGLKTASFSQCKKLTVISNKNGKTAGAMWDLHLISKRDDWVVVLLNDKEINEIPYSTNIGEDGTLVLWNDLDRLCEGDVENADEDFLNEKFEDVEKHISLVFHRFLSGEIKINGSKFRIFINDHEIEPFDPFCTGNKATQILHEEIIRVDNNEVRIQPFILPHHSKLSQREHDFYKNRSDFLNNQGAYMYRNGRLMAWGDWFRLVPKGEPTKLARVRIDFPSSLDEQWTIDIKKSRAHPPYQVREQLKKILGKITEQSINIHKKRGKKLFDSNTMPLWLRFATHSGISYELNRKHPLIIGGAELIEENEKKNFNELLKLIESSIPIESIYSDYSQNPKEFEKIAEIEEEDIFDRLEDIWSILFESQDISMVDFKNIVLCLKPFRDHSKLVDKFIKRKNND